MADVLARLIRACNEREDALDAHAAESAADGSLRSARLIQLRAMELRRERDELHAMRDRLFRRFYDSGLRAAATPSTG